MRQFVLCEESQCRALHAYLRHNWPATQSQDDFDAELNDTAP